ncbi:MAG: hypothetical protein MZV70_62365 [Desulfobacterales bacterium]|nr:hypothetical protein [Desulfobacterales bacterium]
MSNTARFKATEKSIEQAKESFRIESLKYELGKGSITDVLDAAGRPAPGGNQLLPRLHRLSHIHGQTEAGNRRKFMKKRS